MRYATIYFNVDIHDPLAVWSKLYKISKLSTSHWNNIFKLIGLCLCTPYSNASLERFFSYLGIVNNDWRNRLNEENLTDLLRIKVVGPSLEDFDKQGYCKTAVHMWFDIKQRRLNQSKRKQCKKRHFAAKSKRMAYAEKLDSFLEGNSGESSEADEKEEDSACSSYVTEKSSDE